MRLIAFILFLIGPTIVMAKVYGADYTIRNIGKIQVTLTDNATDGCWTNLKEVKVYAEDKLEMAGADVMPFNNRLAIAGKENFFDIAVNGTRVPNWGCHGTIKISIGGYAQAPFIENGIGLFLFSNVNVFVTDPDNFNNIVLNVVKNAVAEWEE